MKAAWTRFKVGNLAPHGFSNDCKKFSFVSHVCHVDAAISILELGEMRPSLIYGDSVLNDQRILVNWLSPNDWSMGYRYGNIRFQFELDTLIKGQRFYWVEDVDYSIEACRVLVTDKRHDELQPYDPTIKNGPWWHDAANDSHYFNGDYCLEFMFEGGISLEALRTMDFVDHHPSYCSVHPTRPQECGTLGFNAARGGAVFLARMVAMGGELSPYSSQFVGGGGRPNDKLLCAFWDLCVRATRGVNFTGNLDGTSEFGLAASRAICSAISYGHTDDAKRLSSLFTSDEEVDAGLAQVISKVVGLTDWRRLV